MKKSEMVGHLSIWLYYNTVYSPMVDYKDISQNKKDHFTQLARIALGLCEDYGILKEWEVEAQECENPKRCCKGACHDKSKNNKEN